MKNFLIDKGIFLGFFIAFIGACLAALGDYSGLAFATGGVGAIITIYSAVQNGFFKK